MTAAAALRCAPAVLVLAGYVIAFRGAESGLAQERERGVEIAARLELARAQVRHRAEHEAERRALAADVRRSLLDAPDAALTAAFLRDLATIAARRSATVGSVALDAPHAPDAPDGTGLTVTLDAAYAGALAAARDCARSRVLADVALVSLARVDPDASRVRATLHVTLHHPGALRAAVHREDTPDAPARSD